MSEGITRTNTLLTGFFKWRNISIAPYISIQNLLNSHYINDLVIMNC